MTLTKPQRSALAWLAEQHAAVRASQYARATYPDRTPYDGSMRRLARSRAAGGLLSRLERHGWARVVTFEYGVPLYVITDAGREALAD